MPAYRLVDNIHYPTLNCLQRTRDSFKSALKQQQKFRTAAKKSLGDEYTAHDEDGLPAATMFQGTHCLFLLC